MESLESQNDERVEGLRGKVKMLKDITLAINEEVRTSTSLMESMNDSFDATRRTLGRTMAGMLAMAKRTGVGWRAWVGFFAAVGLLFWWVWI
jgi:blocked-early-in-transport protein 1